MEWNQVLKLGAAGAGAAISYAFGGWAGVLSVLLILSTVDYVTGFLAAAIAGQLSSAVGFRGIARKLAIWLVVLVGAQIDRALGQGQMVSDAAVWWYMANEVLSVVENLGRMGVPVPPAISKAVQVLQKKDGGD
jgi:toxin secretion/phage lysis holin